MKQILFFIFKYKTGMENICRLCLNDNIILINPIDTENHGEGKDMLSKIFEITTVSVSETVKFQKI